MNTRSERVIEILQLCTMAVMWIFAASITLWVLQLARVAYSLKDAFTASVGISMIAIPVFWTLAAILTYTFFGLRRTRLPRSSSVSRDPT
jgi:ABC-type dipeptide/oligopeptide/nickel transport system permease component